MKKVITAYFKSLEQAERALDFIGNARLANSKISLSCPVNPKTAEKYNEEYPSEFTGTGKLGILPNFHGVLGEMPLFQIPKSVK